MSGQPDSDLARVEDSVIEAAADTRRLHRRLTSFDALLLTLSCLSPVFSVYGPGSDVLQHTGTGAAALFLLAIGTAVIWGAVYAELGSAYPYAGGDYVGVGSVLGPALGFACLVLWAAVIVPINAYLAKMIALYVGQIAPALPPRAVAFGSLAIAVSLALLAVRTNALVTGLFLVIELLAVLALVVTGFRHPAGSLAALMTHPLVPGAGGHWVPVAAGTLAMGAINAAFATAGGNQAIAFGEELIEPHRKMGGVILAACLVGALATALPVIAVACAAGKYLAIFHSRAPLSAFVAATVGPAAALALSAAVALAIFNALIAQILFSARLLFSFARDRIFPSRINAALARVHGASGVPRVATVVIGAGAAACCLLSPHLLLVFMSGLVVYALGLVSLAVLIGRARRQTGRQGFWRSPLYPAAPVLGLTLAVVLAIADWMDPHAGRPSLLVLAGLLLLALLWYHYVLARRPGGWSPSLGHGR